MFILVVDDEPARHARFDAIFGHADRAVVIQAHDMAMAVKMLETYTFDMVCLDHDLGHPTEDGRTLVRWMVKNLGIKTHPRMPKKVLVHSQNTVCAIEMVNLLRDGFGTDILIRRIPFQA
jgi:DNA-binding NarL/FixJ family response regulator